ncbi:MAG: alpha-amylase family glycosyl hydrolase [Cyclobacteriaceae bacterium]
MKKSGIYLIILALFFGSCTSENQRSEPAEVPFPERAKDMVIYEVNVRQYTPEGTFAAFSDHLPRLQQMGVDMLWIMPVQPIGKEKRKGGLGSYYSIRDYTAVNPEFGTMEDFQQMVDKAHELDMLVILDWVANHTAWDHEWINKEGYHTTDSLGNIISPVPDWSDVADLNYDNQDMQDEMIESLRFWVRETGIDGYRCDVAGFVPMEFWDRAKDSLDVDDDLFMLAEWDEPKMHSAFHMTYGWGMHHQMNEISKGYKTVDSLIAFAKNDLVKYGPQAFRMNFTTNHDENSWNGTVFERFGEGHKAFAVLAFTIQGMPLIYSGQEAGLDRRLAFFEKDSIEWGEVIYQDFYSQLIELKKANAALYNGEFGGQPDFLSTGNSKVIAYERKKDGNEVIVLINLSGEDQQIELGKSVAFTDYFSGEVIENPTSIGSFNYYVGTKTSEE